MIYIGIYWIVKYWNSTSNRTAVLVWEAKKWPYLLLSAQSKVWWGLSVVK